MITVTIRCERNDGQFTIAQTTVPAGLNTASRELQATAERIAADGFAEAYVRLAGLPS